MNICATYQIFEEMIFAKVSFTLLILNEVRAQRRTNDSRRRKKSKLSASFIARDNRVGGNEQARRA